MFLSSQERFFFWLSHFFTWLVPCVLKPGADKNTSEELTDNICEMLGLFKSHMVFTYRSHNRFERKVVSATTDDEKGAMTEMLGAPSLQVPNLSVELRCIFTLSHSAASPRANAHTSLWAGAFQS